jgi:hypothetical protein
MRTPARPTDGPHAWPTAPSRLAADSERSAALSDLAAETESLLGSGNEQTELPAWLLQAVRADAALRRRPGQQMALFAAHAAVMAYTAYAGTRAIEAAGLADAGGCSARAALSLVISCILTSLDFVSMLILSRDGRSPSPCESDRLSMQAAYQSLSMLPAMVVGSNLLQLGPILIYLRNGLAEFVVAILLCVLISLPQNAVNALTFNFCNVYSQLTQQEFQEVVTKGELTFEAATAWYGRVKKCRRAVAAALEQTNAVMLLFFLVQAIILYDSELKPWGGWPLGLIYVTNVLVLLTQLEPSIGLNDWPDELCAAVMESTELTWSASERTNFCALVAMTRVKVSLFEFDLSASFRTALPAFFFGWWLYLTELHQFHEFRGFPFDQVCDSNVTSPT